MDLARYVLDGLASGAVIALMGLGVVVIYRSTRVLSFAQGALASLSAYLFFQFAVGWGWPLGVGFLFALAVSAGVGVGAERVAIHPLRRADALTRTIATIGLVLALQVVMRSVWGGSEQFLPPLVSGSVSIAGEPVGAQTLLIAAVTLLVSAGLWLWFGRSLTGLALTAMADTPDSARLLGVDPSRVSMLTWGLAALLGGLAGILATPLLVLNPWQMTFIMVFSYAAALIGGFTSLPLTLLGGLLIGVVRSVVTGYVNIAGLSEALGYIAVFAVLLLARGSRRHLAELLRQGVDATLALRSGPSAGRLHALRTSVARAPWQSRAAAAVAAGVLLIGVPAVAGDFWTFVATLAVTYALLGLSIAILTGWSGQLNLHVAALGLGWGAYAAFALSSYGLSPAAAVLGAGIVTVPFSLVVGSVAVRFRGLELAVATLAIGLTFERLVFRNLGEWLARASEATTPFQSSFVPMGRPEFAGRALHADLPYYLFCLGVGAVLYLIARNLGRFSFRRTLVAIRSDEVAAEVAGVPTIRYRIGAFVLSIAVAATAGALFASLKLGVAPESFGLDLSFLILAAVVIGGIRSLEGGILGGVLAALLPEVVRFGPLQVFGGERLFLLFALGMVLTLRFRPEGLLPPRPAGRTPLAIAGGASGLLTGRSAAPTRAYTSDLERHRRPSVLRAWGLSVRFGGVQALDDADLWLPQGEICALIGPNGAGKSTLFNCLNGLVVPDSGRVFVAGQDVTDMAPHRRAGLGLGRTFQTVETFGALDVLENMMVGGNSLREVGSFAEALGLPAARRSEERLAARATALLGSLGLAPLAHLHPAELSFGHLRMLEIGTALMHEPTVLLLDEPSAGLNEAESAELAGFIRRLRDERGLSVLLVEHDMAVVGEIAEWVYVLDFGRVIAAGPPEAIRRDPLVIERYLGSPEGETEASRA